MKIQEEILGHVEARLLWPETPLGQVKVQEVAEGGEQHVHSRLRAPEQQDSEEARRCKATIGPAWESRREKALQTSLQATPTLRPTANAERQK